IPLARPLSGEPALAPSPLGLVVRHVRELASAPDCSGPPDAELLRRFLAASEHDAFAALVQRHGRMVWGVCRHVLRHEHDAEDACQAAFLILARRAGSIRKGEAVAGWLYGVACRIARKAKAAAAKRLARERRTAVPEGSAGEDPAWGELLAALDDEVCRL